MPLATARRLTLVALFASLACAPDAPRDDFPGMHLLARVEARLEREKPALRETLLDHYGLLFPVEPGELHTFMRHTRFHGDGPDLSLGTAFGPESHGGGLLRMLFDFWRPEGRAPRLDDRYRFESNGAELELGHLYRAHQQQLFLPDSGLPRVRFRFGLAGGPVRDVELDAYKLLSLLIELEPDPARTWTNRTGHALSVERLIARVREHYLASAAPSSDPPDHSNLHLVELLVAFGRELGPIRQRFVTVDLAQEALEPKDASFLLSHTAESLGHLLEAPGPAFREPDAERVTRWLTELERTRFLDVEAEDVESLCHLARGLRAVRAHQAKLE
jgi:hypothetical protein